MADATPRKCCAYVEGQFIIVDAPAWWENEELFDCNTAEVAMRLEGNAMFGAGFDVRQAPEGYYATIGGTDSGACPSCWLPTAADFFRFVTGPGAAFTMPAAVLCVLGEVERMADAVAGAARGRGLGSRGLAGHRTGG